MSLLALNLGLALVWVLLTASFSLGGLLLGYGLGFAVIAVARPFLGTGSYLRATAATLWLVVVFFAELVLANLQLARDTLRRRLPFAPGFVRYEARGLGPNETVLLALMISFIPGSLCIDVDDEGHVLHIHSLYAHNPGELRRTFDRFADLIYRASGRTSGRR